MAKNRRKSNNNGNRSNKNNKKKEEVFTEEDYHDEIDKFELQREKLLIGDMEPESENEEEEESMVMGGPESEEDEDIDPRIMERMMKYDENTDDDDEEDNEEDNEKVESWGKKRSTFYKRGEKDESDEEVQKEEEKEAKRLQSKHYQQMNVKDFEIEDEENEEDKENDSEEDEELREKFQKAAKELDKVSVFTTKKKKNDDDDDDDDDNEVIEHIAVNTRKVLSKSEKLKLLKNESPEFNALFTDFKQKLADLKTSLSPLLAKAKKDLPTHKGISLLEVEYQLLLSYCLNISYYFLLKSEGRKVEDHPVILHLVKLRVLLEKIRPIEQKLRYQIEKLLRTGEREETESASIQSKEDPLRFKPTLSLDTNESDEDEEDDQNQVYSVKKIAPAFFDDATDKKKKQRDRQRKLAARSAIADYVQSEFTDLPEEEKTTGVGDLLTTKESKSLDDIQRYEEEYFVRLTESKKDRKRREQSILRSEFDNPIDYRDISGIEDDEGESKKSDADSILKKSKLSSIINNLEQRRKDVGGDVDIPRNQKRKIEQMKAISYPAGGDDDEDDFLPNDDDNMMNDDDDEDEEDDEYYQLVQAAKKRKLAEKDDNEEEDRSYLDESIDDGEKRPISWKIKSNKGLTPHRKKEVRNPRKKYRNKAEKADKKRSGLGKKLRDQSQAYGGEATGIKKNLTKSRKL